MTGNKFFFEYQNQFSALVIAISELVADTVNKAAD